MLRCVAEHLYGDDALRFLCAHRKFLALFSSPKERRDFAYGTRSILMVCDSPNTSDTPVELLRKQACECCGQVFTLQRMPVHLLKCSQNTFLRYRVIVRFSYVPDYFRPFYCYTLHKWKGGERGTSTGIEYEKRGIPGVEALHRIGRFNVQYVDNTVNDDGSNANPKSKMGIMYY